MAVDYREDLALARQVARGDAAAWDRFLRQYSNIIFSVARKFSKDYDGTMDIYLYVLRSLRDKKFKKMKTFNGRSKLSTWLVVVGRNLCVDHYRSKHGRTRLFKAVARRCAADQLLFHLYYQENFSMNEIYEILRTNYRLDVTPAELTRRLAQIERDLSPNRLRKLQTGRLRQPVIAAETKPIEEHANPGPDDPARLYQTAVHQEKFDDLRGMVAHIVEHLPRPDKLLVKLLFLQQLPAREVAKITGMTDEQAVYTQSRRLLRQLRSKLKESGFTDEAFHRMAASVP